MPKWCALLAVLMFCLGRQEMVSVHAQDNSAAVEYSRHRHFRIPITIGPGFERLKQLQLFMSTNQGISWEPSSIVAPDAKDFQFTCNRDGLYWFAVQTLDRQGTYFPATMDNAGPSLKVLVDTIPPDVQLEPIAARNGQVAVQWRIREEYYDPDEERAFQLEYRVEGGYAWVPIKLRTLTANSHSWDPQTNAQLEVRLRVTDRAGNVGEATTKVRTGQNVVNQGNNFPQNNAVGNPTTKPKGYTSNAPNRRMVNSKRVRLNYGLNEVGPSGVSSVELWYTSDGRSWLKLMTETPRKVGEPEPLVFDVEREGIYGFTIVAKSGVGLGTPPPQVGDPPQLWLEVDLTKPRVELTNVIVGNGIDKGKLTVSWIASDKNIKDDPVTLSYAESIEGPWEVITQHAANSGRYVWSMPENVPYQFYVRVEAADTAGNVGEATSRDLIKVDLSQPRVKIIDVAPHVSGGG